MKTRLIALGMLMTAWGCATPDVVSSVPGFGAPKVSDEEQVALLLDDVHRGMEARSIYKVLAHVSSGYHDAEGRNYDDIKEELNTLFKEYRSVTIRRMRPGIQVRGDRAVAVETFGTNAQPQRGSTLPTMSLQGQVTVYLERINGRWQIVEWGALR